MIDALNILRTRGATYEELEESIKEIRRFAENCNHVVAITITEQKRPARNVNPRIAPIFTIDECNIIGVPLNGERQTSNGDGQEQ